MADTEAKAMGASDLERRMEDFDEEWGYGIGQLRKFSDSRMCLVSDEGQVVTGRTGSGRPPW